jgi:ribonuclease HII
VIAGVDEAGRGCLAGPVVATAVILLDACDTSLFKDSKLLSVTQRESLYTHLLNTTPYISTAIISSDYIDGSNILHATMIAMKKAILNLRIRPEHVIIDGNQKPELDSDSDGYSVTTLIKGDQKEPAISAASIIAKVTRDHIMDQYDSLYPHYQFSKHKGYGTTIHYNALFKYGASPIHRYSFNLTKQLTLI